MAAKWVAGLGFLVGTAFVACGRAAPAPVRAPVVGMAAPRGAAPPATAPEPVRWLVDGAPVRWFDAIPTGSGTLYVTDNERMLVTAGSASRQQSGFLLPGIRAVVHIGSRWGFVQPSGAVYVTKSPLGPPILLRGAPEPYHGVIAATGKHAILVLAHPGPLLLSTDMGRTWSVTATALSGRWRRPAERRSRSPRRRPLRWVWPSTRPVPTGSTRTAPS